MKIAHLLPAFSAFNGIAHAVHGLAEEQEAKGNDVTIFALESDMSPPEKVSLKVIGIPRYPTLQKIYRVIMPLDVCKAVKWVPQLRHFDVIYGHFYPMIWLAYLAKRFYGAKFIFYNHGTPPPEVLLSFIERNYIKILNVLTNWIIKRADDAISISLYLQQELKKGAGLDSEVVYHRIDAGRFHKGLDSRHIRNKYDLGNNPLILYVGRISPHKGCHFLLEAFRLVKRRFISAKLMIVGEYTFPLPTYYDKLKAMADDSVIFTGYVADEELPSYYATCDVYATGTVWEGFNLPLVEAQACGKPIVAFNIGPHPEVVRDGEAGFLVPIGDINAFAEAIIRLLENDEMRQKMGENGHRVVKEKFY